MRHEPARTLSQTLIVFLVAGACAALPGCGGSRSSRVADEPPAVDLEPLPTSSTAPQIQVVSTPASPEPGRLTHAQPADATTGLATDGWGIVDAATGAEAPRPVPAPPPTPDRIVGPNIAAQLYGELLDTPIPDGGGFLGQHTVNIRQISFTNDGSDFDPQISRDGERLVFSSTQHTPTSDIYIKDVGSRVLTRLTDDPAQDVMPSLSPDGSRIAFASNRSGNWDIWVMPVTGGKAIQVTSEGSHDLHPSWSPEGDQLVFCRLGQTSGRWELWVAAVYDNAATQFIGYGLFPEWCPIGGTGAEGADQILFQRSRERGDRTFAVWTIDFHRASTQAGRETQIASDPQFALINPSWSPRGDRVAYAAVPNPEAWLGEGIGALPPSAAIWMVGIDGRGEVPLTSGNSIDLMPTWSPRGQVVFVSNRAGVENLWALDIAPAILAATGEDPQTPSPATAAGPASAQGQNGSFVSAPTEE